ncbi:MAG TPA: hypothetical protein VGH73_05955 [Thermoanaerobaculia bacterium]|jgi:hypothetical protein
MNATKILGAALVALLAAGRALASDLWIHVKVHGAKDVEEATINLPLSMARNLAGMVPEDARSSGQVHVHDKDYSVADLRRAWRELEHGPDATYLTVNDPDSRVLIAKRGDYLELRATDKGSKGENVEARIPLPVMAALLSGSGDRLNVDAALEELTRFGEGELLTVTGDAETVRIWVDHAADAR